jgi:rare lipoprotein A
MNAFRLLLKYRFAIFAALLAALAGCSNSVTQDFPAPATSVSSSAQRDSAIGTPGNPPFYEVFGERYHVLPTADGYHETGIASWYGPKFHGNSTSNGEIYDMHGMTAAHKTLPIPSWVEVTNLSNGQRVILRVNDRGPFVDDRVIDLSFKAATELDMIANGTARVEVRVLDAPTQNAAGPPQPQVSSDVRSERSLGFSLISQARASSVDEDSSALYVQVGAFADRTNAIGLVARLKQSGFEDSFVLAGGDGANLYRVRIGPLEDSQEFDRVRADLRSMGVADSRLVLN